MILFLSFFYTKPWASWSQGGTIVYSSQYPPSLVQCRAETTYGLNWFYIDVQISTKAKQIHKKKWDFLDPRTYLQDFQTHSHGPFQTLRYFSIGLKDMATKIQVVCLSHHLKKAVVVYPDKSFHIFHLQIPHM